MPATFSDQEKSQWYAEGLKDADATIGYRVKPLSEVEIILAIEKHTENGRPCSLLELFHIAQLAFVEKNFKLLAEHRPEWFDQNLTAKAADQPPAQPLIELLQTNSNDPAVITLAGSAPVRMAFQVTPSLHGGFQADPLL